MPEDNYIFVTGGVLSGLGKGLISASVSKLLQLRGLELEPVKCDGYLNVDPGTMNPEEHGEVYVLEDGTEVDMDFGPYERFLDIELSGDRNLTSGKIFKEVIDKEREGDYLGETVQMIPHVTDHIKQKFETDADITVIEVGGTVGDIENRLYLEALRQLQGENTFHIHATYTALSQRAAVNRLTTGHDNRPKQGKIGGRYQGENQLIHRCRKRLGHLGPKSRDGVQNSLDF